MFYRGGMSPVGYFNRDGWFGRGPVLGKADTECNGDVCVIIASRLTPEQAKVSYDKMKYAMANKPDCIGVGTPGDISDSVASKLEKAVLGIESSAPLSKSEADYLAKFEACVGTIPPDVQIPAGRLPQAQSSGVNPLVIGASALGIIALVVAFAK